VIVINDNGNKRYLFITHNEFDKLYENIMQVLGVYKGKGEFRPSEEWTVETHLIHDALWNLYIEKIREQLKTTGYYAKFLLGEKSYLKNMIEELKKLSPDKKTISFIMNNRVKLIEILRYADTQDK